MNNPALVLHLTGHPEPLSFALSAAGAKSLSSRMNKLMSSGAVDVVELADTTTVSVNFAHVATAHIEELPPRTKVYGHKGAEAGLRPGS